MLKLIRKISRASYKILAVSYTIWLTAISLTPLDGLDLPSFSYADKIVHFLLYLFLTLFWLLACPKLWQKLFLFFVLIILWGIGIEFIQEYFIPTRSGDVLDALANTLGGLSGLLFFYLYGFKLHFNEKLNN